MREACPCAGAGAEGTARFWRGKGLPDDFDFDSEIEVLPGAVRGEGGGLALDGESQAGAVAEGEALGAGLGSSALRQRGPSDRRTSRSRSREPRFSARRSRRLLHGEAGGHAPQQD